MNKRVEIMDADATSVVCSAEVYSDDTRKAVSLAIHKIFGRNHCFVVSNFHSNLTYIYGHIVHNHKADYVNRETPVFRVNVTSI